MGALTYLYLSGDFGEFKDLSAQTNDTFCRNMLRGWNYLA